ncbi:hypothetical protein [Reichenbachiella agariperforans]|uniref:hypothetical protein n=1 Tax=Reichenbachiella agariperforans TaxID=156994 RepID=UPI001C0A09B6|nr:hypothetical protein [Reichenbachiella agariperforans]MBU2915767.1 hypothetical protein [Reichenbachiella agariperforans]
MQTFPLTGFDTFLLALEQQYNQNDIAGNTCYYVIDLEGALDHEALADRIISNEYFQVLSSLRYEKEKALGIPKWHLRSKDTTRIEHFVTDQLIPQVVLDRRLGADVGCLSLDTVARSDGRSTVILSWNHLLMDGYGAVLFLKRLLGSDDSFDPALLMSYQAPVYNLSAFWKATKAKFFIDYTSRPRLSMISPPLYDVNSQERVSVLDFDPKQVRQIEAAALHSGARFGRSAFFLACIARAVQSVLVQRGDGVHNFWIPVPRDNRRKGALGPIIGNRLSFLFYRLKKKQMSSIESCVDAINNQMRDQIKHKSHESYNHLMDFMKWLPLNLYYYLVKRRGGNAIASFLFTVAADHPSDLETVMGQRVINALSLPANAYPPGLTFAMMNFRGSLKLMILYHTQALSDAEYSGMAKQLQQELLMDESQG